MKTVLRICLLYLGVVEGTRPYHEQSKMTFSLPGPLRNDSYFGYSFAYVPATERLIISAPRADNIGQIYSCDMVNKQCQVTTTNITRANPKYDHDYWLGATVKAGDNFFTTCAPRFAEIKDKLTRNIGQCYYIRDENVYEPLPKISETLRAQNTGNLLEKKMDTFGWSMDISAENNVLTVGGPGMFTGRVEQWKYPYLRVQPSHFSGYTFDINFNFGYSVASGIFLPNGRVYYAIGSPYGKDGRGKVLLTDLTVMKNNMWLQPATGDVGTMFGAVLCSAKFSSHTNYLLVGAPASETKAGHNAGEVYVYGNATTRMKLIRKIVGAYSGGMFGSAIVSVGDLNNDGSDEIAISSPYEDNFRGVVYIYDGAELEDMSRTSYAIQKLQSKEYGFGLSLSALPDYDSNGCYELAIGSPYHNSVTVLRCMAQIKVKLYTEIQDLRNRRKPEYQSDTLKKNYFQFKACLQVVDFYKNKLKNPTATIKIKATIQHPSAVLADPHADGEFLIQIKDNVKTVYCESVGVDLPENGNYILPLNLKLTGVLVNDPYELPDFDRNRITLDNSSALTTTTHVWATECQNTNSCDPKFSIQIRTDIPNTYTVGSSSKQSVTVEVHNSGEIAYQACVLVSVSGPAFSSASQCARYSSQIDCSVTQPIRSNQTWVIENIELDMTTLTNHNSTIELHASIFKDCNIKNPAAMANDTKHFTLKHNIDYIEVRGRTNLGNVISMTPTEVKESGKQFEQIFTITNLGKTAWLDLTALLELSQPPNINYQMITIMPNSDAAACLPVGNGRSHSVLSTTCNISRLGKEEKIEIAVIQSATPSSTNYLLNKVLVVSTNMTVEIEDIDDNIFKSIETALKLHQVVVDWWIYIIAALVGFFLLIIVVLILREFGFLQRQNKRKVADLRKSIRRQTIRRSMAQSSHEAARPTSVPCQRRDEPKAELVFPHS